MYNYTCPFCGGQLHEFGLKHILVCTKCSLSVDFYSRNAYFGSTAPKHLSDSFEFLREFHEADPTLALSPHKLYSKDFDLSEVIFVGGKDTKTVTKKDIHTVNIPKDKSMHLIGGKKVLADNILKDFTFALLNGYDNPLNIAESLDANKALYVKVIFNQNNFEIPRDIQVIVNAYFRSTFEGKLQDMCHLFSKDTLPDVTEEEALYSFIFTQPNEVIGYRLKYGLRMRIKDFISAVLSNVEDTDEGEGLPFDEAEKQLLMEYLKTMPSTAINVFGETPVTYDVLSNEYRTNPMKDTKYTELSNSNIVNLLHTYVVLSTLCATYCPEITKFGYERKLQFLKEHGQPVSSKPDANVFNFWRYVKTYLKEENLL